jgi:hypothetical protein
MKGIVFTEFLDMVEKEFGYEVVDHIIEESKLDSGGVYTSIGTYPHSEIVQLLMNLSSKVLVKPTLLLKAFGKYLFETFAKSYPQFFSAVDNAFDFLKSIDNHIHVEVLKLYPDATLPKFNTFLEDENEMRMVYRSERKMAALAEGLMEKSIEFYNQKAEITTKNLSEDGTEVEFRIQLL